MQNAVSIHAYSLAAPRKLSGTRTARARGMYATYHPHPFLNAVTSVSVIGAAIVIMTSTLTVVGISTPDYYAIVGMGMAQVIVLIAIRQMQKSFGESVSAFAGTGLGGVALPGFLINALIGWGWMNPEFHLLKYWHTWVLLGFVGGLAGWPLASTLYQFCLAVLPQKFTEYLSDKFSKKP